MKNSLEISYFHVLQARHNATQGLASASLYKATTTNAGVITAVAPTVLYIATSATKDHQSISTKSIQFLLPLWAWAALLLGVVVLLSVTIIWIMLVVGWKKNKRRKRRDDEVKLSPRSSSCWNSNLWIDEVDGQGQSVEGLCTRLLWYLVRVE